MTENNKKHFYMVPPTYFDLEYMINDWMVEDDSVDSEQARQQWDGLVQAYESLGVKVSLIDPVEGVPDLTFAGDSIFLFGNQAVSSKFRFAQREPEATLMADWFRNLGYGMHSLPEGVHFEGNAEAILWNGELVGGYGIRSDRAALFFLAELLDLEIIPVKLSAPYYHLDTAFCPINSETIAIVPQAFDQPTQDMFFSITKNVIVIHPEEANILAANSKAVGDTVILSNQRSPKFVADLHALGLKTIELDLSQFFKSGAGAKCLTLEAYPAE